MALVFENLPRSASLVTKRGFPFGSHFYYSAHHQCRRQEQEKFHPSSESRSRILFKIAKTRSRRRDLSWSTPASVRDLFDVLDEESDDIDDEYDIEEEEENEEMVSDAEALLACWSFLKRRKRLGDWTEHEERKSQKLLSRNYFLADDEFGDSFLHDYDDDEDDDRETHNKMLDENDTDFNLNEDDTAESMTTVEDILWDNDKLGFGGDGSDEDVVSQDLKTISSFVSKTGGNVTTEGVERSDEKEDIDLWHTEFTSFPTESNPSRRRRVDAMKRRWEDPDYRKRWYEKRWGSKSSNHQKDTPLTDRERQAVQRARALPSGFLGSDELASMTEEEIAEAIRTRMRATRRRVASRKETLQRRRDLLAKQIESLEMLSEEDGDINLVEDGEPRGILFWPTEEALKAAQRKRSERAKKLYATRLENKKREEEDHDLSPSASLKTKPPVREKGPFFPPKQPTPQDAFLRIENDLDHGTKPSIDDVRLVLKPGKMKNRKLLFSRILQDEFGLTGKCVPLILNEGNGTENAVNNYDEQELAFVKRCTIERLGNFVVHLLKTAGMSESV